MSITPIYSKIALVEDTEFWQENVKKVLEPTFYEVAEIATDLESATALAKLIVSNEISIAAVLLDANLSKDRCMGEDAKEIIQLLDQTIPIIGFSSFEMDTYGINLKYDLTKYGLQNLPTLLDSILSKPS